MITFAESVAAVLRPRITELAARWTSRALAATPRRSSPGDPTSDGVGVVQAVVACLDRDARWQGEVMRLGWTCGASAHAAGLSVHHVLKDADLLLAVLLTAVEEAARGGELAGGPEALSEAFAVSRRLQRAVGLHAQAAASSYQHALVTALRTRWRVLRHDLRNPLGTIRSALSLMEDEALPPEARTGPRIRAMVARNAGSLESLIAARLDDRVAASLVAVPQEVSLRDVALAVRRSLREPTRLAECEIVVDDALPEARVDEAAVELTLSTLLLAALSCAHPGDVLRVEHAGNATHGAEESSGVGRGAVALRIVRDARGDAGSASGGWDAEGLALSAALAGEYGGRVALPAVGADGASHRRRAGDLDLGAAAAAPALELELPLLPNADTGGPRRVAPARPARGSERHLRDDVPRAD